MNSIFYSASFSRDFCFYAWEHFWSGSSDLDGSVQAGPSRMQSSEMSEAEVGPIDSLMSE